LEVNPGEAEATRPLASVSVGYKNLQTKTEDALASSLQIRFTTDAEQVKTDTHNEALVYCSLQITTDRNRQATALRDAGRVEEAQALLVLNYNELLQCKLACPDGLSEQTVKSLDYGIEGNRLQSEAIVDGQKWKFNRKAMRQYQNSVEQQQRYTGKGKIEETKP
jgi:Ca-activated chloride channel family protein